VRDLRAGKVAPTPVGWVIWALLCAVLTTALALAGGRAQLGLPVAEWLGCTVIAAWTWLLARRRAGRALDDEDMPRWLSVTALASVAVALAVVVASAAGLHMASPVAAAVLLLAVDLVAAAVAVNRVFHDATAESVESWWWYAVGEGFCLLTAIGHSWIFWASSGSGLLVAGAIIGMAWRGSEHIHLPRLPQWTLIPGAVAGIVVLGFAGQVMMRLTALRSPPATRPLDESGPRVTHSLPSTAMLPPPPARAGHLPPGHHIRNGPVAVVAFTAAPADPLPSPRLQHCPSPSQRTQRDEPGPDPHPSPTG
jgi:hypothetical protein